MALTDRECANAQRRDKPYKLADGNGLYLEVLPSGGRYWRLKYRHNGKERRLAFGVCPETSLAEARAKRQAARKLIADGIDPLAPASGRIDRQTGLPPIGSNHRRHNTRPAV